MVHGACNNMTVYACNKKTQDLQEERLECTLNLPSLPLSSQNAETGGKKAGSLSLPETMETSTVSQPSLHLIPRQRRIRVHHL